MRGADAVDAALEAAVVPSFTRIGPMVRSRLEHWPAAASDLTGRVIVITGATSGLGIAAARAVIAAGASLELVARNPEKAETTASVLRADEPGAAIGVTIADTGDLDAVRDAAAQLHTRHERIHALVHNAGALDAEYRATADGIEGTIASQIVGPFLLSALLADRLAAAAPGRIIWVSSGGMYTEPLSVAALDISPADYRGTVAYARAKRAQVTLTEMMAARVDPGAVVVHAMHPGWALTPGVERSLPTRRLPQR